MAKKRSGTRRIKKGYGKTHSHGGRGIRTSVVVKAKDVQVLKVLALMGGSEDYVHLSSRELGETMNTTQQTASLRILELLKRGYITRNVGARKQGLILTSKGIDVLRQEHADYMRIFEFKSEIEITGSICSGLGEGKYYISLPEYKKQFKEKLWFVPFPGTVNVKLAGAQLSKLKVIKASEGIEIKGFQKDGRTFGAGRCYLATLNREDCAIIIPNRSHYVDVLEVISSTYLRGNLKLKDGDAVELCVSL